MFQPSSKLGAVATVRAGNVIGGADYAQDRIVHGLRARADGKEGPILVRNPASYPPLAACARVA